tara:strand:- start:4605 stop:5564 length:960 start_codon:yes stop_codon:yes gene_type:complete
MSKHILKTIFKNTKIPVIGAPMFIVSNPELVIEQCKSGIIGCFPALNARGKNKEPILDDWLQIINLGLMTSKKKCSIYGVNQIIHKTNKRLEHDMSIIKKYRVPFIITSLGINRNINDEIHSYGGIVFHDVTNNKFAKKAIDNGADGLIAICSGAGGHAGNQSPFALMQEIREWYDGPVVLGGSISSGRSIKAAQCLGADAAYIGSPFIATHEANSSLKYKNMIVESTAQDITNTDLFTGINGNYLTKSIIDSGVKLEQCHIKLRDNQYNSTKRLSNDFYNIPKAWSQIWAAGQGISNVTHISNANDIIEKMIKEYNDI